MSEERKSGSRALFVGGSRLRRITADNKLIDYGLQEGGLVEVDTPCKVVGSLPDKTGVTNAYVVEMVYEGKVLTGWVYSHELAGR